jgi:hypothetical protein
VYASAAAVDGAVDGGYRSDGEAVGPESGDGGKARWKKRTEEPPGMRGRRKTGRTLAKKRQRSEKTTD